MKLKNSYLLLIAISIFLLIGIGSVCASDVSAETQLTDDGSNVVLADDSANTTTQKIDTDIVCENAKIRDTDDKNINVAVKDNESNDISVMKNNLTVTEGNKTLGFSYNNSQITITDKLSVGNHSLIISYLGNDIYKNSTKNIVLSIFGDYKIEASSSINVNQSKIVEMPLNVTDGVDVKDVTADDFNVEISYKDGNDTKKTNISDLTYKNGKLMGNVALIDDVSSYTMIITYNESGYSTNKTLTLNVVRAIKIEPVISEVDYQDGAFTFKITDAYTGEPLNNTKITVSGTYNSSPIYWDLKVNGTSIVLNTAKSITTDSNGIATIKNENFYPGLIYSSSDIYSPAGNYNITFSGSGFTGDLKTTVKINKINTKVIVEELNEYYGTSKKITMIVVNAETNKPLTSVPLFFNITDSSGKEVVYSTTNNNTTTKINAVYTNANGTVALPANNLGGGQYSVYAFLNNSDNYDKSEITKTITIKQIPVTYAISSTGAITVTNKLTGKAVAGAYVVVTFDGDKNKVFVAQTDKNGKITITTVGKHKIAVSDKLNGEDADLRYTGSTVSKTITNKKITAKASAPSVSTYYKTSKYFTATLTNSAKKAIYDAKLNIKVYLTSGRYYEYKGNTDIYGQVRLQLNTLTPKTYKVVITSGDTKSFALKKVTSKIVIKKAPTTLTPKKLTAKKGTSTYFKVTVKNTKTKKVITGVKVKVKVYTGKKYKTYTVKTNSKGIAYLNVKSLAVGTHKAVVTSANSYCVAKSVTSTIKITK